MTRPLDICINTQTPLIQFLDPPRQSSWGKRKGAVVNLADLQAGQGFRFSPGGVTRMVFPLVQRLQSEGELGETHWVSLNPSAPSSMRLGGLTLHNVAPDRSRLQGYGSLKEAIWRRAHGMRLEEPASETLWTDAFSEYGYYNRLTAELMRRLDHRHDFDLFYIHDFQQMPVGGMLEAVKPKILRWHIPFEESMVPPDWRSTFDQYLSRYDMVVVSTNRYLRALRDFGYSGPARRIYPYVDVRDFARPPASEVRVRCSKWGISPRDEVILIVARMDPTKGHDRAIRALARLVSRHARLKLVLVGNGSFSGSKSGLALARPGSWRGRLESLVRKLDLQGRVVFAGHVSQHELDCFYERSLFTILPSLREGFGLVVVESWLHRKPTIISDRAGITELVRPGENGLVFDPTDEAALSAQMERLLDDARLRQRLGAEGRKTARLCSLATAAREETRLMKDVAEA